MSILRLCLISVMDSWKTLASLTASSLIRDSCFHFPRVINSPIRTNALMTLMLHFSRALITRIRTMIDAIEAAKNRTRLKMRGSTVDCVNRRKLPRIRNAMFIPIPRILWITTEARTLPLVPHCSLFTK